MLNASRAVGRGWWQVAAGGLLAAAVLAVGGLRATASDDRVKSDEPRKEKTKGAESGDAGKADQDMQKQLDELRSEMKQLRQDLDRMRRSFPGMGGFGGGAGGGFPGQPGGGAAPPIGSNRGFPGAGGFGGGAGFGGGFGRGFGTHPRLGVLVDAPSETLAEQLNLKKGQGLVVREVVPDSPAAAAGLKTNDIILDLNGKAVPNDVGQFSQMVGEIKSDTPVDAKVLRKGKEETIKGIKLREGTPDGGGLRPLQPLQPARPGADPNKDRDKDQDRDRDRSRDRNSGRNR